MISRMDARVDSRGRVTIPVELRRKFGITPDTRLIVREEDGIVVMTMASYVRSLRGKYRGMRMAERLRKDRRSEAEREEIRFKHQGRML